MIKAKQGTLGSLKGGIKAFSRHQYSCYLGDKVIQIITMKNSQLQAILTNFRQMGNFRQITISSCDISVEIQRIYVVTSLTNVYFSYKCTF